MAVTFAISGRYFLDNLAEVIFEKEMASNERLRNSNYERKEEMIQQFRNLNIEQRSDFIYRLKQSFIIVFIASILGIVIAGLNVKPNQMLGILSLFCFSWATLGRLGWKVRTFAGDTPIENLDNTIFWFLYFSGTLLGVISIKGI